MGVIVVAGLVNPTSLAPTLLTPANGVYLDLATAPTFTWQYNPGQTGLTQTKYAFLRLTNGGSVAQFWNASGPGSWQSTPIYNTSAISSLTFPNGAWIDGNIYQWAIQTVDANGVGAESGFFTINAQVAPQVTVTAPSGTISTADPLVTWTLVLARGAQQTSYRVVIYNSAQYTAGGFTPGSGPSVYDSGQQGSSFTFSLDLSAIPIYLPDSTSYRCYVQVTETGGQFSAWSYAAFSTSYTAPATPTVTALAGTDLVTGCPLINVSVQGGTGSYSGLQKAILLRSDGAYVRNASPVHPYPLPAVGEFAVIPDYEVTSGVGYTYTAQVLVITGTNASVISATATSTPAVTLANTEWWEFNPLDVSTAVAAQVIDWEPQVTEQSTAHLVMGQATPNVVANLMGGLDGQATFWTQDPVTYAALEALLQSQATIFVSSPFGASDTGYVRWGPQTGGLSSGSGNKVKDSTLQPSTATGMVRTTAVTWVSQARVPV